MVAESQVAAEAAADLVEVDYRPLAAVDDGKAALEPDALADLGVTHIDMPLAPERVWRAIEDARGRGN